MTPEQARALFLEHCQPGDRGTLERYGEKAAVAAILAATNQAEEVDDRGARITEAARAMVAVQGMDWAELDPSEIGYWESLADAALVTQPATSQEEDGLRSPCLDPRGAQCGVCGDWFKHTSAGYCSTCIRNFKVPDHTDQSATSLGAA